MVGFKRSNSFFLIFTNLVIEPACFDRKPDALYRGEVEPIGRQVHRLPVMPMGAFTFVPCAIAHNQKIII